jgi:hypothetical protein
VKTIIKKLVPDAPEVFLVAGGGAVCYGVWMIYAPAGFIVGGMFMLVGGWLGARSQGK